MHPSHPRLVVIPSLALLALSGAAAPVHSATEVGDLLTALMFEAGEPSVLQSWSFDAAGAEEIAWQKQEIEWSEEAQAYTRTGSVSLQWRGGESDGLGWQITLLGGRAGPMRLEIDSVGNYPQLDPGLPELDGLELTPRYCDDAPTFGMIVYEVEAPGKRPAFLLHEWSCGSAGCSVKLELHLEKTSLGEISGIPPCPE